MLTHKSRLMAVLVVAILLLFVVPATAFAAGRNCQEFSLEVELSTTDPTEYTLVGDLCWKGDLDENSVMVLNHGGTYNSWYWDITYQAEKYSFVKFATNRGYATFNVDRLGSGRSDTPSGFTNNLDASAYSVAQVVEALRDGEIGDFDTVILVGHSFGSLTAVATASQFGNVDGVVLTGYAHSLPPDLGEIVLPLFYPAEFDPKWLGSDPGYLTTVPGSRATLFYNTQFADPNLIANDELNKDRMAISALLDLPRAFSTESLAIDVPVLLMLGGEDLIGCAPPIDCSDVKSWLAFESPFFSEEACLTADIIPNSGHDLNTHPTANQAYSKIITWADGYVLGNQCQ